MALKCSGVHRRTGAELGLFFFLLCTNSANYGIIVLFASWGGGVRSWRWIFECSEWGKVRYSVVLGLVPLRALSLVKMAVAVAESIVG